MLAAVLVLAGVWRRFGDRVSLAIAWSIRICRQPAASAFSRERGPYAALAWQPFFRPRRHPPASEATPTRNRLIAWLSNPRQALLAAVLILTGAVGLDALSDPDVWWHIRLGDWIIAHHQIPAGELFAYTAFGNPLVAHEWLSETIFAALAAVGGLVPRHPPDGPRRLERHARHAASRPPSRCRACRARHRPCARSSRRRAGARYSAAGLHVRPGVLDALDRRVVPALRRPAPVAAAHHCSCSGRTCTRDSSRGSAFSLIVVARRRSSAAGRSARLRPASASCASQSRSVPPCSPRALIRTARRSSSSPRRPGLPSGRKASSSGSRPISRTRRCGCCWRCCSPSPRSPITVLARPSLRRHFDLRDFALAAVGAGLALTSVRNTAICVAVMIPPWMAMAAGVVRSLEARRAQPVAVARPRQRVPVMGIALLAVGVVRRGRGRRARGPDGDAAGHRSGIPVVRGGHAGIEARRRSACSPHTAPADTSSTALWPRAIGVRVRGVDLTRH